MILRKTELEREGNFTTPIGFFWRVRKEFLLDNYFELELRKNRKRVGSTLMAHKTYPSLAFTLPEACRDLLTRYQAEEKVDSSMPIYGDYK